MNVSVFPFSLEKFFKVSFVGDFLIGHGSSSFYLSWDVFFLILQLLQVTLLNIVMQACVFHLSGF